jgi:hypothetical protein
VDRGGRWVAEVDLCTVQVRSIRDCEDEKTEGVSKEMCVCFVKMLTGRSGALDVAKIVYRQRKSRDGDRRKGPQEKRDCGGCGVEKRRGVKKLSKSKEGEGKERQERGRVIEIQIRGARVGGPVKISRD